jgi:hypothetical protein
MFDIDELDRLGRAQLDEDERVARGPAPAAGGADWVGTGDEWWYARPR